MPSRELTHIEVSENHPAEVLRYHNGNRAILFREGRLTYQIDIQHAKGVFNPTVEALNEYLIGQRQIESGDPMLTVGATFDGACPADCSNCPFARSRWKDKQTSAKPVTPEQLIGFVSQARQIGIAENVLSPGQPIGIRGYGAGDPSYYQHLEGIIEAVGRIEGCTSSGWSSIARGKSRQHKHSVLRAVENGFERVRQENPAQKLKMQFSIHDTRHAARVEYTGEKDLFPLEDIAESAGNIYRITGRRPNLVFVLKEGTQVDPEVLINAGLTPDLVVPTCRMMDFSVDSPTGAPMDSNGVTRIYKEVRSAGFDVAWIPPTPTMDNLPPIELSKLHTYAMNQGLLGL